MMRNCSPLVCVQHIAKIEARDASLLRATSRIITKEKMAVLAISMDNKKLHLMAERSRVARLVKIRAGRENFPTKTPIPLDSLVPKTPRAPAAQPRPTVRKICKSVGSSSSIPSMSSFPVSSFEERVELSSPSAVRFDNSSTVCITCSLTNSFIFSFTPIS